MKELFRGIRHNLPSILKAAFICIAIAGAVVAFLYRSSYQALSSICTLAILVFLYSAWNQFTGLQGVGPRPLGNGGFINAFVRDAAIRDDNYNAVSQAIMEASDYNLLIANLLAALFFVAVALVDYLL